MWPDGYPNAVIVKTETSTYLIDRKIKFIERYPGDNEFSLELRRDGEMIKAYELGPIVIGEPMCMVIDILQDGTRTLRTTTPVVSVEEIRGIAVD